MKRLAWILLPLFLLPAGCGDDDDPVTPVEKFEVTVRVVDEQGAPVAGLALSMVSDNPFLPGAPSTKALTHIECTVPTVSQVAMRVEDMEGELVRRLVGGVMVAGQHMVVWDAKDHDGVHQPSGRFRFIMEAEGIESELAFRDTVDGLLTAYWVPVDTTDADGLAVLTDRRHFPSLYDTEPMVAMDESGVPQGWLEPTDDMIFYLADGINSPRVYHRTISSGKQTLDLVWNVPAPAPAPPAAAGPAPLTKTVIDPPPTGYTLKPPYPNPFN